MKVSIPSYSTRLRIGLLLIVTLGTYVVIHDLDYGAHQSC